MNRDADPIDALLLADGRGVLAIISRVEGPSYRPVGAMMAILPDGSLVGSLSSGCIEADLVLQAKTCRSAGRLSRVIYGRGSPFMDIKLPCGGGLEILLLPDPDTGIMSRLQTNRQMREPCTLDIDMESGTMSIASTGKTAMTAQNFQVALAPEVNFFVFGKGPEASTFAGLVQSAGFQNVLLSPDDETLNPARISGSTTIHLRSAAFPLEIKPDQWSAVVLFFHDHEWEPPILLEALATPAFYIGAQGSQKARDNRIAELVAMGATKTDLARLQGPIGLIPSTRDARTLTVSVLAEILSRRISTLP